MKAYLCIGGPLDGQFATSKDFEQERYSIEFRRTPYDRANNIMPPKIHHMAGKFADHSTHYHEYNSGRRNGCLSSMVWIYKPLLRSPIKVGK